MHCTTLRRCLLLFGLATLPVVSLAQGTTTRTVTGTVRDTSGTPIPFVNVEGPRNLRALGDDNGRFHIILPAQEATSLTLRRLGYHAVTLALPAGADTSLTVHLDLVARQLAAVQVVTAAIQTLRNRGFYDRIIEREQGLNTGQFITPEEIELRKPSRPTQLFDARMSVVVRRVGPCYRITQCWVVTGPSGCIMQVYLDGQRLLSDLPMASFRESGGNNRAPVYLDDVINPSSIAGIEIYSRGASAPPKYQMPNSTCGVILIWTK